LTKEFVRIGIIYIRDAVSQINITTRSECTGALSVTQRHAIMMKGHALLVFAAHVRVRITKNDPQPGIAAVRVAST
jgi:hypothetical protein